MYHNSVWRDVINKRIHDKVIRKEKSIHHDTNYFIKWGYHLT